MQAALAILKRAEIQVWDGHVCQAVRELGKLRPLQDVLAKHQDIMYRIKYNLEDGRHPDGHADLLRVRDRLLAEYKSKFFTPETAEKPVDSNA